MTIQEAGFMAGYLEKLAKCGKKHNPGKKKKKTTISYLRPKKQAADELIRTKRRGR